MELLSLDKNGIYPLAGGTDLLVLIKQGIIHPSQLVSLKDVPELHTIDIMDGIANIGGCVTVSEIAQSDVCQQNSGVLDVIRQMATLQIRNRATIGGNLCTAAACADFPPVLLVNDANVTLRNHKETRTVDIKSFFTGPRKTVRQKDELLVSVSLSKSNIASSYIKLGLRKAGNIPVVGVACSMTIENDRIQNLRVAVTAASPIPVLINDAEGTGRGEKPGESLWDAISKTIPNYLDPITDLRGSKDYRLHMASVLTKRSLEKAYNRSLGNFDA